MGGNPFGSAFDAIEFQTGERTIQITTVEQIIHFEMSLPWFKLFAGAMSIFVLIERKRQSANRSHLPDAGTI